MFSVLPRESTRLTEFGSLIASAAFSAVLITPATVRGGIDIDWTDKDSSGFSDKEKLVVDAAITGWETLISSLGSPTVAGRTTISVSIKEMPDPHIGSAFGIADAAGIPLSGTITIDPGTSFGGFYVDEFPTESSEFAPTAFGHYGKAPLGSLAHGKKDLLTIASHELGHVLGFYHGYSKWSDSITPPSTLPYSPTKSAILASATDHDHLKHIVPDQPYDLMATPSPPPMMEFGIGDRRLPSALDLDILKGIYSYTVDHASLKTIAPLKPIPELFKKHFGTPGHTITKLAALSKAAIPEPATLVMFVIATIATIPRRRSKVL